MVPRPISQSFIKTIHPRQPHIRSIHPHPRPSSYQPVPQHPQSVSTCDPTNLFELSADAPIHLQKQALQLYHRCRLSSRHPITRFAIARQMRNLDLPPHRSLWQSINSHHEHNLYRWIDQAFGQLLYMKSLWKPSDDWKPKDDMEESNRREDYLQLLRTAYQDQIVTPLQLRYGHEPVASLLSSLKRDEEIFIEPPIVWEATCPESGDTVLEWMSERTADVVWPGLVSCQAHHTIARRYWESEARSFASQVGGVAKGMGPHGQMLDVHPELGDPSQWIHDNNPDSTYSLDEEMHEATSTAEAILIRQYHEDRQLEVQ